MSFHSLPPTCTVRPFGSVTTTARSQASVPPVSFPVKEKKQEDRICKRMRERMCDDVWESQEGILKNVSRVVLEGTLKGYVD